LGYDNIKFGAGLSKMFSPRVILTSRYGFETTGGEALPNDFKPFGSSEVLKYG
jgi:hypothetical protein